ncbi:hypothetical protein SteCoe_35109 [Stentor coeruleus]|uniref:Uncharacterized protein n=1 Tax=Stentor coeruleus TaxID=5963 RepID=A0A1R2AT33_9CILI|nr:hypothetical protein SteCoe_35109 [Stentor coeruleus]
MNRSFSQYNVTSSIDMVTEKPKFSHASKHSDLNLLRTMQKKQKSAQITVLTQEKLIFVESEWAKYKTTKSRSEKIVFPKDNKLNNICGKRKKPDELIKLATSTAELLGKKPFTPINGKNNELKGNLLSSISEAKKRLIKKK